MKTLNKFKVVPAALAMILASGVASSAQEASIQINGQLPTDPFTLSGQSGGTVKSNCGNVSNRPNHIIRVTRSLPYLRLTVQGQGRPTLFIDGPGGSFCILADPYSATKPEMSGYWQEGSYSISVGNLDQGQYSYSLSITQQKLPPNTK